MQFVMAENKDKKHVSTKFTLGKSISDFTFALKSGTTFFNE